MQYCQRTGDGFRAEPVNALTHLAFLLAAAQRRARLQAPCIVSRAAGGPLSVRTQPSQPNQSDSSPNSVCGLRRDTQRSTLRISCLPSGYQGFFRSVGMGFSSFASRWLRALSKQYSNHARQISDLRLVGRRARCKV